MKQNRPWPLLITENSYVVSSLHCLLLQFHSYVQTDLTFFLKDKILHQLIITKVTLASNVLAPSYNLLNAIVGILARYVFKQNARICSVRKYMYNPGTMSIKWKTISTYSSVSVNILQHGLPKWYYIVNMMLGESSNYRTRFVIIHIYWRNVRSTWKRISSSGM